MYAYCIAYQISGKTSDAELGAVNCRLRVKSQGLPAFEWVEHAAIEPGFQNDRTCDALELKLAVLQYSQVVRGYSELHAKENPLKFSGAAHRQPLLLVTVS